MFRRGVPAQLPSLRHAVRPHVCTSGRGSSTTVCSKQPQHKTAGRPIPNPPPPPAHLAGGEVEDFHSRGVSHLPAVHLCKVVLHGAARQHLLHVPVGKPCQAGAAGQAELGGAVGKALLPRARGKQALPAATRVLHLRHHRCVCSSASSRGHSSPRGSCQRRVCRGCRRQGIRGAAGWCSSRQQAVPQAPQIIMRCSAARRSTAGSCNGRQHGSTVHGLRGCHSRGHPGWAGLRGGIAGGQAALKAAVLRQRAAQLVESCQGRAFLAHGITCRSGRQCRRGVPRGRCAWQPCLLRFRGAAWSGVRPRIQSSCRARRCASSMRRSTGCLLSVQG